MNRFLLLLLFLFTTQCLLAQSQQPWNDYYGSNRTETKQKLEQYLQYWGYQGVFTQTDTTLGLHTTLHTASWTIYSTFYFDKQGKCFYYTNTRCDSMGFINVKKLLTNKSLQLKQIDENKYITRFPGCELIEIITDKECQTTKRTKLYLTKKQYKEMWNGKLCIHH